MMRQTDYNLLCDQLRAVSQDITYDITILSNASALLYDALDELNWAGFYLYRDGQLLLGPFQGKVACTSIAMGRGVCGSAAQKDQTVVVEDVHSFPGHIACDSASNSEIVIPLHCSNRLYGVLDIDSPGLSRFSKADQVGLERFALVLEAALRETQ